MSALLVVGSTRAQTPPQGPGFQVRSRVRTQVVVLADKNTRPFRDAITALKQEHSGLELVAEAEHLRRLKKPTRAGEVFIALGPKAAARLASTHLESSKRGMKSQRVSGAAALLRASEVPTGLPAVRLEVPPSEQAPWIARAFPGRSRLLVLRRPGSLDEASLIAASAGQQVMFVDVDGPDSAVFALERALKTERSRVVVWLLPDPAVITANTVGPLVQTALSARVPIVGFSPYFLRVGALAAVETDFGAMALRALRLAKESPALQFERKESIKVIPESPPGAHLRVNGALAGRLGIAVRTGKGVVLNR